MGYAQQAQHIQTQIASYEKNQPALEIQQANIVLDACQMAFEMQSVDNIKNLAPAFARSNNPTQAAWLGYQTVAMLLAPNTLHGNKAALVLLGDWGKQLKKTKASSSYNAWLAATGLLVQRNMQTFIARGDFAKVNGALQKMQELRMQAHAPFAKALLAGMLYEQYRRLSNPSEAHNALEDFTRNFEDIETLYNKQQVLAALQRFNHITTDSDAFLSALLKTAVAAINSPQNGNDLVAASALLMRSGLQEQADEVKSNLATLEPAQREQRLAQATIYDQIAHAQHLQQKGEAVAALTLMGNLSNTLTQLE